MIAPIVGKLKKFPSDKTDRTKVDFTSFIQKKIQDCAIESKSFKLRKFNKTIIPFVKLQGIRYNDDPAIKIDYCFGDVSLL